jgi:hypothetical protein
LTEWFEWATVGRWVVIMPKNRCVFAIAVLIAVFFAGAPANAAENARDSLEFAAQTVRRPHIVIHPRRITPGPNARRYCRFWLAQQYRVSGPVVVPQQQCWWR